MDAELAPAEYAFLIILKAEGREHSNTEMDRLYHVRLVGDDYAKLNGGGYVSSYTKGRPYRHTLTQGGLDKLAKPLAIEEARTEEGQRRSPKEKQLWAAVVAQHNDNLRLLAKGNDAAVVVAEPDDLDGRIRATYAKLAGAPGDWVDLTALRPLLADISKAALDKALVRMLDAPDVRLEPEPFGHRIGVEERRAAVHVGGEDGHKLAIGLQ
jgi:hypothetical protein